MYTHSLYTGCIRGGKYELSFSVSFSVTHRFVTLKLQILQCYKRTHHSPLSIKTKRKQYSVYMSKKIIGRPTIIYIGGK